jgi:hypothetical protein
MDESFCSSQSSFFLNDQAEAEHLSLFSTKDPQGFNTLLRYKIFHSILFFPFILSVPSFVCVPYSS